MTRDYRFWIGVVVLGLVGLFVLQNVVSVQVTLLFWTFTLPRVFLIVLVFAAGFVVGWAWKSLRGRPPRA